MTARNPAPLVHITVKLRPPAADWLYALRLRMGRDGQLAETSTVVRMALERFNASPDALGCAFCDLLRRSAR